MNTSNIRAIENCFSNKPVDLSMLVSPTTSERKEFMNMLETYKMEEHVNTYWNLVNSGHFQDLHEQETGCPF